MRLMRWNLVTFIVAVWSMPQCNSFMDCTSGTQSLNIQRKCGESYSVSLQHNNISRSFLVYIPSIFCDDDHFIKTSKIISSSGSSIPVTVPILIALHCIGCNPSNELAKWQSDADTFGLLLIIPRGGTDQETLLSWNSDQCCGPALAQNRDDIGFIQKIIHGLQCPFSKTFPLIELSDKNGEDSFIFVTGFSNGGFMTDKIAWSSTVNTFPTIIAAAPTAGYIYDHKRYIKDKQKQNNIAMYFHHSKTDFFVNPNGCCTDHTEGCCCGIAQHSDTCLSLRDEFKHWLTWNNCNQIDIDTLSSTTNKHMDCFHATPAQHGCDVLMSLCMHNDVIHTQWAQSFPLTTDVVQFFVKSLCLHQNGQWNGNTNECQCDVSSKYQGVYCITKDHPQSMVNSADEQIGLLIEDEKEKNGFLQYVPETSVIMICIVFLSIGFFILYKKSKTEYSYSKLALDEQSSHSPIIEDINLVSMQTLKLRTQSQLIANS
eukprot:215882_1